jgi:hypothetical protein
MKFSTYNLLKRSINWFLLKTNIKTKQLKGFVLSPGFDLHDGSVVAFMM